MNRREEVCSFVAKKLAKFAYAGTSNAINAELARLRRGIGKSPGEIPEIYGTILQDMPEEFWDDRGNVTVAEWSCYIPLTLYALHQQGNDVNLHNVNTDENVSIGTGLRTYINITKNTDDEGRMLQRLKLLVTSKDMKELSYHMKNVVQILKGAGISLNYVNLARDIYDFQFAESKSRVCLRWAQDFYRMNTKEKKDEK